MQRVFTVRRLTRALALALLGLGFAACDMTALAPPSAGQPPGTQAPPAHPTAIPQPTVPPAPELLERALQQRAVGEYDAAAADLHTLLTAYPDAEEARRARFYLAESFALRGRWSSAAEAFRRFLAGGPQDDLHARALFWLARCHEEAGAHAEAIAAYDRYRALHAPLAAYAQLRQAAQLQALGQIERAAETYEAAAATDIARGERAGSYGKAIALRRQLGQHDQALGLYSKLLGLTDSPADRAPILAEAAALAAQRGASDQARAWRREIVTQSPATAAALDAVAELLADPQGGLEPAAAAQVYAVHEQFAEALPLYDAAIAAAAGDAALELRRLRALARRATGDFDAALDDLAAISAGSPGSDVGRQAQLDWVQTRGQRGETQAAIDGYRQFAQTYPDDPRAPEALNRAAILLSRLGDAEGAAQQYLDLGRRYPASEQANAALDQAGWYFFNAGRLAEAQDAWDMLRRSAKGVMAARGAFWAARAAQQNGHDQAAQDLFAAAIAAAPDSYYAARAAEILKRTPAGGIPLGAAETDEHWREAEDWIASWSGTPAYHVADQGYPPEVADSSAVAYALALADVGLQPESIAEWNEARAAWSRDPVRLYLVARLADQHGVPYIALKAAEDLLDLAPDHGASAPGALLRLVFPAPYSSEIIRQATGYDLDPRALYALLRQESLFNPGATSWAGARGLAQVMPATGQGIAQNLGVADFQETDLYRPAVSIRFGAFYLSHQLKTMNGSLPAALSAYNGGPGNAQRWAGGTTVADPDLFTEAIDYEETRSYVRLVYGSYGVYQRLYRWP